jgi:ABC-type transporter MlaC component
LILTDGEKVLGTSLAARHAGEQQEFVMLFTDLLQSSYADQIEAYNGEKIVWARLGRTRLQL